MMKRRGFMLTLTTGLVALGFVVGTVIADELLGTITKVDVDGKVLTVVEKDTDKEIKIKVTDETETVYKGATKKLDLEKLEKKVDAAIDKGAKGVMAKIYHEKKIASKIQFEKKKKTAE
jgi:hypothetical protein